MDKNRIFINKNDSRWDGCDIDFTDIINRSIGGKRAIEVSVTLINDDEMRKLNREYRGIDSPTNVLSFESGDSEMLGDIFISYDTAMKEAGDRRFENHVTHLVVHGVLHLQGYDHIDDADAEKMEAREIQILKEMGIGNPYSRDWRLEIGDSILLFLFGAIGSLGFAPFGFWWATAISIGALYWMTLPPTDGKPSTPPRGGVIRAVIWGAGYGIASFWWILHSIYVVPELQSQFAIMTVPAVLGIGLVCAVLFAIPTLLVRISGRGGPIIFAAAWTFVLWLREWIFTGFPWNPIANITLPWNALSNSMSLWGALGLTFIVVGLICSVAEFIRSRQYRAFYLFVPLLIIGIGYGHYNIKQSASGADAKNPIIIRIVQPSFDQSVKMDRARADASIEKMAELSQGGVDVDLVVWPETSYPFLIAENRPYEFPNDIGAPVIFGATTAGPDGQGGINFYNSMVGYGVDIFYHKSHLVPFGEYRPFGDIIPTPGQLTRGNGAEIFDSGIVNEYTESETNTRTVTDTQTGKIINETANKTIKYYEKNTAVFVPAICYEIVFSDSLIPRGTAPDMIINITNDNWFGNTPGSYQHLDMVRRQAIETGLPVMRAAYSGISAFVGADGRVISSLPIGATGALDGHVWGAHKTPYRRIGLNWWMIIILACAVGAVGRKKK
ncbi:MAG: apolipoprotein N-acyltransferase [Rickettsiales bacterium]|jgi:apolipoprotein N-acyltransferase|nr:apolipoprotein N-acyltransferase [Rickettsiales bacterium]